MVEFVLISVLLIMLLFGVLQVAALFYVRSVTSAAAADGARYAANADVPPGQGGGKASELIRRGLGPGLADQLPCTGTAERDGPVAVSAVRCRGRIRSLLLPIDAFVRVDVTARSLKDGP
ncbi:MAG TPA: TadE family protein [Jatrophihabitans sp.]|nr:TadE family protein [Jatrophihabitans sp.]